MTLATVKLSVIVITKNEEGRLLACLESTRAIAHEWIVVDSMSTDRTCEIARDFGARVFKTEEWPGFGPQKNVALDQATGDWVLSLDADECLSPPLASEIEGAMQSSWFQVWSMPRLSSYCGKFIRHSGWYPDPVVRLFKLGAARFSDDRVHERVVATSPVGRLNNPIIHHSFQDFSEVLEKVDRYSTASAEMRFAQGQRGGVLKALGHGAWAFFKTYILKLGFLDGPHGLALAISNAEGTYYRYMKLWLLGVEKNDG